MAPSRAEPGPASPRRGLAPAGAACLLLALGPACTRLTDQRVRQAWGGAGKTAGAGTAGPVVPGDGPRGEDGPAPVRVGWDRVDEILDGALAEANLGTDDEVMARLAERWCRVQPEAKQSDEGPVLVCIPNPPVQVDGHAFTLELGGEGVIGLVAAELSAEESSALADEALRRTERWCTRPWNDVSDTEPSPAAATRLHTCPTEGSALVVVARFVSPAGSNRWQVSVAVIDAS